MIYINNFILSPRLNLILGLLFIPAYLLQQSLLIRSIQLFLLITLYILQGGRFRIISNMVLVLGIVLAYIVRPSGKVLFVLLEFPITEGSLISGLTRALMLIGLIYISRLSVSSKIKFEGKTGNLILRVFYYFEAITENQIKLNFKTFYKSGYTDRLINYIDKLLIYVENKNEELEKSAVEKNRTSSIAAVSFTVFFILVSYIML